MTRCPSCNATIRIANTRQCPSCGAMLEDDAPTRLLVHGEDTGPRTRPVSRAVHLVALLGRTRVAEHRFDRGTIGIGRDGIQDLVLDNPSVSRRHCQIRFVPENGSFVAEDLGSDNGTLVNGARITSPAELVSGDELGVGKFTVLFNPSPRTLEGLEARPLATAATTAAPAEQVATTCLDEGELDRARDELAAERGAHLRSLDDAATRFPLEGRVTVLGRSAAADVPLRGWLVGRRHAEITRQATGRYVIRKTGGLLAVLVNNHAIRGAWELTSHDRITIGRNRFQFFPEV